MKKNISKILIMLILAIGMFSVDIVSAEPIQPALSLYFETDLISGSIPYNGSVVVAWKPTNTTSCVATGGSSGWAGDRSMAGIFVTGPLTATTTYSMTCNGGLGTTSVTKSIKITVGTSIPAAGTSQQQSSLTVVTDDINNDKNNITYTTAILKGHMSATSSPTLPITAYFRYSKLTLPPVFCNDIYGANMISTKDIDLGTASSTSFYQPINNLIPDTTYYYCAILSDKENIIYGGSSIVKNFHTSPYQTTVRTTGVTSVSSESAVLNGTVSSIDNVTTYFQYKVILTSETSANWESNKLCETTYTKVSGAANIYEKISCNFSKLPKKYTEEGGLIPNTKYQFRAAATTSSGTETKTTYGSTLTFTTNLIGTTVTRGVGTGPRNPNNNPITRTWNTGDGGRSGTWVSGTGSGTWTSTTGTGGTGTVVWSGTGNSGTWTSSTGSGTWSSTTGTTNATSNNGTWSSTDSGRRSGTWGTGTGSGTWVATSGVGGTGTVTWIGLGSGSGTWTSPTGSGTWTTTSGTSGTGAGTTGTWTNLALGETATPPSDAIVRYHEGIETVFTRQIVANENFAKTYGYQTGTDILTFAWDLSDQLARMFGYVNASGREIRVSQPDIAAYQLQLIGNQLTVYEYYNNQIVDIRNITTVFKNASNYEYYFTK